MRKAKRNRVVSARFAAAVAAIVLCIAGCAGDGGEARRLGERLDAALDSTRRAMDVVGASAAVVFADGSRWEGASGLADFSTGDTMRVDMPFNAGSIGKNYTAALAAKLVEEGRLSLDATVGEWFPPHPGIDEGITIRQLLNHTSGIFDFVKHRQSPWQNAFEADHAWTPRMVLDSLVGEPYFPPGEGWHYSTTNYLLLRLILERELGEPVSVALHRTFFAPLGLEETTSLEPGRYFPDDLGMPVYRLRLRSGDVDINAMGQAWETSNPHLIIGTPRDLAAWIHALFGEKKALGEEGLDAMLTFHAPTPNDFPLSGYGLGCCRFVPPESEQLFGVTGLRAVGHVGSGIGYRSVAVYLPERGASLALCINDNDSGGVVTIASALLAIVDGEQARAVR